MKLFPPFCALFGLLAVAVSATVLVACPFCSVTSQTLSEEMSTADTVVLARLARPAAPADEGPDSMGEFGVVDPDTGSATFEIDDIIKGEEHLLGVETIDVIFFGPPEKEKSFLITGIGTGPIDWTTPLPLTEEAIKYVRQVQSVPAKGADRLEFFQSYLEHDDPLLAQDAYDEFARAPYSEVIDLKDRMHHDRLVDWIKSPEVSPSRRRLYLTMLGVCGKESDIPMLEEMILSDHRHKEPMVENLMQAGLALGGPVALPLVSEVVKTDERRKKLGLDAMIACYLRLRGAEGLDAIDERFLEDEDVDYTHTYSTLMALRFHGEEADIIPKKRLLESMRLLLDHTDFADQVIPDLARWDDWSVLDRLVQMYRDADGRSFIRQPVVTYVLAASEQEGDIGQRGGEALAELSEIDPEAVERAKSLMAFGFLGRAQSDDDASNYTRQGSPFAEGETTAETGAETASVADATVSDESAGIPDPAGPEFADDETPRPPVADDNAQDGADNTEAAADADTDKVATDAASADEALAENADSDEADSDDSVAAPDDTAPQVADAGQAPSESNASQASADTTEQEELTPPSSVMIVGVPLLAAAVLAGLFWVILRSGTG